jgi:hypothetical protein
MEEKTYTQKEIMDILIPMLKSDGVLYKKSTKVLAREAMPGEQVNTFTSDGFETSNTAKEGDFVIKNQTTAQELYIIGGEKFRDRYELLEKTEGDFSIYKAKGKVMAIEMTEELLEKLKFPKELYFIAPWDEKVIVKKNDFLVCPIDFSEIYRIARKEFFETYQLEN